MASRKAAVGEFLASDVRNRLRSMILGAELKPGQRLVEDDLCERLNVGRTPVREALLLLQGEGFLSRERGWVVETIDRSQLRAIFESRAAIEAATARLAARHADQAELDALARMIEAMEPAETLTRADLNSLNTQFHKLIVTASKNILLAQFHERTQFHYWMLRVPILFSESEVRDTNIQHRKILEALVKRDEEDADRAARLHVEATMAIVEPAIDI
ncbi:GntR family transcriptional regulator [Agrobacterium sp. Azo12]|jgi:DNA-binding GntR family transcriptional regulator|uniref:GntR family transcriptional regulator n=1 Tax=Agrobacterium sp. Azo12 TaxID=3031129 RepID=UPI0023D7BB26|nr:GntR family transcriptional regulator [Agrobacterium sp. Azo12]MDO5898036.1 GntR family transcriptional regulator [Agrobacterium sp. Azo12]